MKQYEFAVRTAADRLMGLYVACMVVVVLLIVPGFFLEIPAGAQMLCYIFALLMLVAMFVTTMLRFEVVGTVINVRSCYGKKYKVSCSEITKIVCTQSQSTHQGLRFAITITTNRQEFTVDGRLSGFALFAGYLLNMLDKGEIPASAASENCRKMLRRYQKEFQPEKNTKSE